MDYSHWAEILRHEGFSEIGKGTFVYRQPGATPWFFFCPPDPDGYLDREHLLRNLEKTTPPAVPYLDIIERLVRRLEQ